MPNGQLTNVGVDTLRNIENVRGTAFNDNITGNGAANTLDGRGGIDTMTGGGGDDTFIVDNPFDVAAEAGGQGVDKVRTSTTYTLLANSEIEVLETTQQSGTAGMVLTGNGFDNTINGNNGINLIVGGGGRDTMTGFGGNDTYFVDNANDRVVEAVNGGNDTVNTSVSYRLELGSEVETLQAKIPTATSAINLTGNRFTNTIVGNDGNNLINGGDGGEIDRMTGRLGNDTYVVDNVGDIVTEQLQGGIDRINTSVSLLTLADNVENVGLNGIANISANGNGLENLMEGNDGRNTLDGGIGTDEIHGGGDNDFLAGGTEDDRLFGDGDNDTLVGGLGADKLTGGSGGDVFQFRSAEESGFKGAAADEILDFSAAQKDKIDLSQIAANLHFIGNNNLFTGEAGDVRFNAGQLEGDLDGDLNADFRIQVNVASLVDADFIF